MFYCISLFSADGSSGFKAEAGRYHIYVSLACPWAHRVLCFRALKGLEDTISVTVVDWLLGEGGWNFTNKVRPKKKKKKKLAVFGAPLPTLNFCADPTTFFNLTKKFYKKGKFCATCCKKAD